MNGKDRVQAVLEGVPPDRPPFFPIAHTALAPLAGVPLGRFFSCATTMADVLVRGCRSLGLEGVQLSSGVTGEAEALGADVTQPENAAPQLNSHVLASRDDLARLAERDPVTGGRMPLFFDAVSRVSTLAGREVYILATLRGPFLICSQLRGVKQLLLDTMDDTAFLGEALTFACTVVCRLAERLRSCGAHGILLGEATCSPNFIAPAMYRELVLPHHTRLVEHLHAMGWPAVGLHICGDTTRIIGDIAQTGADFMDVDAQVSADVALAQRRGRLAFRGNLDPSSVLRYGDSRRVASATQTLRRTVSGTCWMLGSGCDIPPGTPRENLEAFADTATGAQ